MLLFTETADRAKAMGVFGFVLSGGGVVGVLAGGILTDLLSWHWIFFVNLPVGHRRLRPVAALAAGRARAGRDRQGRLRRRDHGHRALMLAVYAIVNGNEQGWSRPRRSACSARRRRSSGSSS